MTRKNKARYGLARSYRIKPTVKILRATIVASALAATAATVCAAPLPQFNSGIVVLEPFDVVLNNTYDYTVGASYVASGIQVGSYYGDINLENSGSLDVYADASGFDNSTYAIGILASGNEVDLINSGDLSITAHTDINGYYTANATGIRIISDYGDSLVANTGNISIDLESSGVSFALGIKAQSMNGNADIQNYGDISIVAHAGPSWAVIDAINGSARSGDVEIDNSGDINITLEGDYKALVNGVYTYTFYDAEVANSGNISISSFANSDSYATAINADSAGNYTTYIHLENTGDLNVVTDSVNGRANARGIVGLAPSGSVVIENTAEIRLVSESEQGSAYATGIVASSRGDTYVSNSGDIYVGVSANVSVYHGMSSFATGILGGGYEVSIENNGNIWVQGFAENGDIEAAGIKGVAGISNASTLNSGDVSVFLSNLNDDATSVGISLTAVNETIVENSGDLEVVAESENGIAQAYGIRVLSRYDSVVAINSGSIKSNSENGTAIGLIAESYAGALITNTGTIEAGGYDAWAIVSDAGLGATEITNTTSGSINGAISTGAGYDRFVNQGFWYVGEDNTSIFGDGGDFIINDVSGKIFMEGSSIDLGAVGAIASNSFLNNGKLYVNGTNNIIDMGGSNSVFTNNGNSIHMDDGAADDSLAIVGDFNGTGGVFVDVDGANLTSDTLLIDGNVLAGTANTVSINFVTPVDFSDISNGAEITIISVTGNSTASNFVLNPSAGGANGLYTFDYSLNYSQGDYSLAFDIGMSGLGTLATTLSPALQSIWYNSMGTVYQREGSARSFLGQGEDSGGGVWTRVYGADGSYVPDATKNNFGGSTTANFDMSGIGLDAGVGYAFNQQFVVGAILGTTDTDVTPEAGGEATVSATSVGAYVSYLPGNGFYGDLYYRWMDFDGDGTFGADRIDYQGKAYGFSFEFGYAFDTASGFRIEPQLQYSDMKVDLDDISYNGTAFVLNDGDSSQLRAGLALSKDYKADWGKWTPYGALSYVDISGGSNDYDISGVLEGSVDMSGSSGLLEVGVTADIGDWILAGGFNWQDGGAVDSVFSGQLNVKYTW